MRKKINYAKGDYFAVPLRNGGFGRGVVARMDGKGGIFGYFFGPRLATVDEARDPTGLTPDAAVLLRDFGDLGLLNGEWLVLGSVPDWDPNDWPMPPLIRVDEVTGKAFLSYYDEGTFECIREERVDPALASRYPRDVAAGYVALEIALTALLS